MKRNYRILALSSTRIMNRVYECVFFGSKEELDAQIDGLTRWGFNSITAVEIDL